MAGSLELFFYGRSHVTQKHEDNTHYQTETDDSDRNEDNSLSQINSGKMGKNKDGETDYN